MRIVTCPFCDSADVEVIYELDDLIVYRCNECGETFEG